MDSSDSRWHIQGLKQPDGRGLLTFCTRSLPHHVSSQATLLGDGDLLCLFSDRIQWRAFDHYSSVLCTLYISLEFLVGKLVTAILFLTVNKFQNG
jgi:hypothetical protein